MARYRCRNCGEEGQFVYEGFHACPICGSKDVQFALAVDELAADDPLIVTITKLAEEGAED
jgi:Zn finger protein HypA/HybF involved in hydrogenase expression